MLQQPRNVLKTDYGSANFSYFNVDYMYRCHYLCFPLVSLVQNIGTTHRVAVLVPLNY